MLSFGENDRTELALWEMSHRFFNSLQVIDGLLARSIRDLGDADEAVIGQMQGIRARVRAISHLHRRMMVPSAFGALIEDRCREVCLDLVRCFGREDVTPWVEMDVVELSCEQEGKLLLLIVELVTNALKHSRADGRGIVWIDLRHVDARHIELLVRDNGASPAPNVAAPPPHIAGALARSLGGDLRVSHEGGFNVRVRFPLMDEIPLA